MNAMIIPMRQCQWDNHTHINNDNHNHRHTMDGFTPA